MKASITSMMIDSLTITTVPNLRVHPKPMSVHPKSEPTTKMPNTKGEDLLLNTQDIKILIKQDVTNQTAIITVIITAYNELPLVLYYLKINSKSSIYFPGIVF